MHATFQTVQERNGKIDFVFVDIILNENDKHLKHLIADVEVLEAIT